MLNLAAELADGAPSGFWIPFSLAAIAGFWTAPSMLYSYLVALGWLLWLGGVRLLRPAVLSAIITAAVTIFLYMPILVVSGPAALLSNPWVRPLPPAEFEKAARQFPEAMIRFLHAGDPFLLPILVVCGIFLSVGFNRRIGRLLAVLLLVLLAVTLLQRVVPFPRVLLPLIPVYYLCAGAGWTVLDGRLAAHERTFTLTLTLLLIAAAHHMTRSGYIETHRFFPESRAVAGFLAMDLRPSDRLIVSDSAGPPLLYELGRAKVRVREYSSAEAAPGRVLVALSRIDGPLPPPGDGLLDPSSLTLEGTLRGSSLNTAQFTAPRLIYTVGRAQVIELVPRNPGPVSGDAAVPADNPRTSE
jgi:hypothetical protein